MSYDLYIQDWGGFTCLSDIPDDFEPQSIGLRSEMVERIKSVEPLIVFEDDSWGELLTSQFSIEFNMGESEVLYSFAIHVRGNELAIPVIGTILEKLNLKAAYGDDDAFFDINKAKENMQAWMRFRDRILESQDG